jgi:hypothetical protein
MKGKKQEAQVPEPAIEAIINMGFSRDQAIFALSKCVFWF